MKRALIWMLVVLAAFALARCVVFADEAEWVMITQFGRPVRTLAEAGLHFKAPYQSAVRIDRRLQIFHPRPSEVLSKEKRHLDLDVYVCWRVHEPRRFLETVTDRVGAEMRLQDMVRSELAAEVGRHPLEAFVSTNPAAHKVDEIMARLTSRCAEQARPACGIEVADVRLKRIGLPAGARDGALERMRAERGRIARQYRAEGEEEALKIRAAAEKERTALLAKAHADAERLRGQAEAEATRVYSEAHRQDPAFYELTRTLEAYRKFLDDKTTILLSSDSDLFRHLLHPPAAKPASKPAASKTEPPAPAAPEEHRAP